MAERLSDRLVKALPVPASGGKITYDGEVSGFGIRVFASGKRAFILRYRIGGQARSYTIGSFPDWSTAAARDGGEGAGRRPRRRPDGAAEDRAGPTGGDRGARGCRPAAPQALGADTVSGQPYSGGAVEDDELRRQAGVADDNPVRGLERNPEDRRERYLSPAELIALAAALQEHADQRSADAIRLLVLTGARRGEALAATWDQFDLATSTWTKPSSHTKQKQIHRVPLSAPAVALLVSIRERQEDGQPFASPAMCRGAH